MHTYIYWIGVATATLGITGCLAFLLWWNAAMILRAHVRLKDRKLRKKGMPANEIERIRAWCEFYIARGCQPEKGWPIALRNKFGGTDWPSQTEAKETQRGP